ncbi:hypothetical protein ACIQCR_31175 [Streptomyces sp. NPDC093249]|uniref:hypothetical protein n=1 Tax=unclassified Streptomyces TaxID=2593676 RepID=UPI00345050AF
MASRIDRVRFQLRALPAAPAIPGMAGVSARIDDLAGITITATAQISDCAATLSQDRTKTALKAYSLVLAPLGEALTELGRMHAEIAHFNFTTHPAHRDSPSALDLPRQHVHEAVTGCCQAADEILEAASVELIDTAYRLASPHLRPAAPAVASALASLPPAAPSAAARAAKNR